MRELTAAQTKMPTELIKLYAHRLRKELTDEKLSKLRAPGIEDIFFAWAVNAASPTTIAPKARRSCVIERDNNQDNANHITVWCDFDHDFRFDPLHAHDLTPVKLIPREKISLSF